MGWFDKVDDDYNKALSHYQNAKVLNTTSPMFIVEMNLAASHLKESIRKNDGVADALVVLANIYYAIALYAYSKSLPTAINGDEYIILSAAVIQHWKMGWRGYNKNSKQGNQVYEMVTKLFIPENARNQTNTLMEICHEKFYENALLKEIQ